jgi:hypothetical protein
MAIAIYPLQLSPATLREQYDAGQQAITPTGGTAPYTWSVSAGALPPGMRFAASPDTTFAVIQGAPTVCDQYVNINFLPVIQNPTTFTITCVDSTLPVAQTASITYTLPIGSFSEEHAISIYEMLAAVYGVDYYIVMDVMGSRELKIGDILNPAFGGLRLVINSYLNTMTTGMVNRLTEYIRDWDHIKLISITQNNGNVDGITGLNQDWQRKRQLLLGLVKTVLPAFTLAEVRAHEQHGGGSDSTGSVTGGGGGVGVVNLVR